MEDTHWDLSKHKGSGMIYRKEISYRTQGKRIYLGIRNTFMVPVGINVNRRQSNKSFTTLKEVGWKQIYVYSST